MTTIAERLKDVRINQRMTQAEFADKLEVKRQTIANIECGKNNPTTELLEKLITVLNVNSNYLIAGIGEPFLESQEDDNRITAIVDEVLKKHGLI